jgi:hypothetical protein
VTDDHTAETENSQPSRLSWWKKLVVYLVVMGVAGTYPAATLLSHQVTSEIPATVPNQVWQDRKIGAAIELLEREEFFGWAAARPGWHPKARLTAMPAYQQGISDIISRFAGLRAEIVTDGSPDSDLRHAQGLLSGLGGRNSSDKLHAGIEALRRFDGRKARNLLDDREPVELLMRDLDLFQSVLTKISDQQKTLAAKPTRGVFNRDIVADYYYSKGQLYAIGILVRATRADVSDRPGFEEALANLNLSLARAARPAPVTVSNPQPGQFSFGGNDIMQQAYLTLQARDALQHLEALLQDSPVS